MLDDKLQKLIIGMSDFLISRQVILEDFVIKRGAEGVEKKLYPFRSEEFFEINFKYDQDLDGWYFRKDDTWQLIKIGELFRVPLYNIEYKEEVKLEKNRISVWKK